MANCILTTWHMSTEILYACTNDGVYPDDWNSEEKRGEHLFSSAVECCERSYPLQVILDVSSIITCTRVFFKLRFSSSLLLVNNGQNCDVINACPTPPPTVSVPFLLYLCFSSFNDVIHLLRMISSIFNTSSSHPLHLGLYELESQDHQVSPLKSQLPHLNQHHIQPHHLLIGMWIGEYPSKFKSSLIFILQNNLSTLAKSFSLSLFPNHELADVSWIA